MSKTQIISDGVVFVDYDSGSEIDAGVAGQKIGVYIPVKNITATGFIILLRAKLFKNGTLIEDNLIHSELYINSGETKEWYSEFYMPDADVLVTAHSYVWPAYPPSSPDYTTMVTLPLGAAAGWIKVAEISAMATVGYPGGWINVAEVSAIATPGHVGGWIDVAMLSMRLSPPSPIPPPPPPPPSGEVPWPLIAAGAVGVGGILLLTGKKKPVGKKKT